MDLSQHAIETVSGVYVDPTNIDFESLFLEDMAWSLSRISRFAGHTITAIPYNVAQHSVFVSDMILASGQTKKVALYGLLHDCAEAFIGDIPSPIKRIPSIQAGIQEIEENLLNHINSKFAGNVPESFEWSIVKYYDRLACAIEAFQFMRGRGLIWSDFDTYKIDFVSIQNFPQPESALISYKKFMLKYDELKETE